MSICSILITQVEMGYFVKNVSSTKLFVKTTGVHYHNSSAFGKLLTASKASFKEFK